MAACARHERPLPGNLRDEREQRRRARLVDDVGAKLLLEVLRGAVAAVAGVPDEMPLRSVAPESQDVRRDRGRERIDLYTGPHNLLGRRVDEVLIPSDVRPT